MKISFRFIAKIGLLLVVLGFFMPIARQNGFELAQSWIKSDKTISAVGLSGLVGSDNTISAVFLYIVFCAAAAGCIIGVLLLLKRKIKIHFDWICVLASIGSGLIVYFAEFGGQNLQTGAYLILAGWIIALIAQFLSLRKKEARR